MCGDVLPDGEEDDLLLVCVHPLPVAIMGKLRS